MLLIARAPLLLRPWRPRRECPCHVVFVEMEAAGIEPLASSAGNSTIMPQGDAESGARDAPTTQDCQGLKIVTEAWPGLPSAIRAGILAMVRASCDTVDA